MALAIVTVSNISLPKQVLEDLPIFIAPLEIHIDGHTYVDGADLSSEEFYKMISVQKRTLATSAPPTTPAPQTPFFSPDEKQVIARIEAWHKHGRSMKNQTIDPTLIWAQSTGPSRILSLYLR